MIEFDAKSWKSGRFFPLSFLGVLSDDIGPVFSRIPGIPAALVGGRGGGGGSPRDRREEEEDMITIYDHCLDDLICHLTIRVYLALNRWMQFQGVTIKSSLHEKLVSNGII